MKSIIPVVATLLLSGCATRTDIFLYGQNCFLIEGTPVRFKDPDKYMDDLPPPVVRKRETSGEAVPLTRLPPQ